MLSYTENTTYTEPNISLIDQWKRKLSDQEIQLIESKVGKILTQKNYLFSGLPIIKVNKFKQKQLKFQSWFYRANFRLKRYGFFLFASDFISRRLKLDKWQKNIKLKLNHIDTMYLK